MRIDHLEIENFKKFAKLKLDLHPRFTLLIGDNGSGKTSLLDALAVALGLWHKAAPGSGWRNILTDEVRLDPRTAGDRVFFEPRLPTKITASGAIGQTERLKWVRMIRQGGTRTTNAEARDAEQAISKLVTAAEENRESLPVLAYYGAGRAWLPTNRRNGRLSPRREQQRFDAYYKCLDTRIRDQDLNEWFLYEAAANGKSDGRPGYLAVRDSVLRCVPGADGLRFDSNLKQIVLSIQGEEQPYYNLSAGQRMMLAMVADIAIKAVTLNSYLFAGGQIAADRPTRLLEETPGVVLIDELDVHLHPKWQRCVASDLKRTFPSVQFICTSHSPQIIGELPPDEIRQLDESSAVSPPRSRGVDSSRVLEEVMGAASRNASIQGLIEALSASIEAEDLSEAASQIKTLEEVLGPNDPEVTRARTLMTFLETDNENNHQGA